MSLLTDERSIRANVEWLISAIISGIIAFFLELFRVERKSFKVNLRRDLSAYGIGTIALIWAMIGILIALGVIPK